MTSLSRLCLFSWILLVFVHCLFCSSASFSLPTNLDAKPLYVGLEIVAESMALQSDRRIYIVLGLEDSMWYEVKISYPASIPARFSIELMKNASLSRLTKNRKLLNTEKLIFKTDGDQDNVLVQVTVEAAGIVAMRNVPEGEMVMYNIVCDQLILGIPHNAWWVGIAAIFCLLMGVILPHFLPMHLSETKFFNSRDVAANKTS